MADPRRADSAAPPVDPAGREGRSETLLVEGLDEYFAGRYSEAIHIWTRVLFFDRAHPRARAYIDRARTALAERQRKADQLLAEASSLLEGGRTEEARRRFTEAVEAAGEDERAISLLSRIERQERLDLLERPAGNGTRAHAELAPVLAPVAGWNWPRRRRAALVAGLAVVVVTLAVGAAVSPLLGEWLSWPGRTDRLVSPTSAQPWPVLTSADVALVRARTLRDGGRLAEALAALDRVTRDSPARGEADALRAQIQAMLLAGAPERFRPRVER
jgi:tetratricopeptide (TPR) repeat protein